MIKFSKIDDQLSIYQKKDVIIYGAGISGKTIYQLLLSRGVEARLFCDSDKEKWGGYLYGKTIISPEQMTERVREGNVIVQIGSLYAEKEISQYLQSLGVKEYVMFTEARNRLSLLNIFDTEPYYDISYAEEVVDSWYADAKRFMYSLCATKALKEFTILCLPPKAGDYSLNETLYLGAVPYVNCWHNPKIFSEEGLLNPLDKIKVVTAVRDPIAQNLSVCYEFFSDERMFYKCGNKELLFKDGGNAQALFDELIDTNGYVDTEKRVDSTSLIQYFYKSFENYLCKIQEMPFDKGKGYSVITKGKYEIFIYQLEKLNQIQGVLLDWLGLPGETLSQGNISEEKWYADSYEQAKKEIKISRKYFDKCYNETYVKHFYSEEDIEMFKNRWSSHIC